ncbi:carboxymuconolactone decarboxylase family protein [Nitratireductor sp. OM-1]|uniref:carboxymuconolactone decarboxylase family protein n=1 Tax=Nitratireductor sp. OM-1 TaxID=1756988 RepID=UPI000DDFA095|nr:carboxymuconolactone decarboxylase family protein [Nitratireductor sp. OM-1]
MEPRLNFYKEAPELMNTQMELKKAVDDCGLEKGLIHLINLRTSQINGCSYCVDMHSREAREDGESEQRVFLVSAWKESPLFSARERAALAWTEQVTLISEGGVPDALFEEALSHFSKGELTKLTIALGMMNIFNRLCIAFHAIHPVRSGKEA